MLPGAHEFSTLPLLFRNAARTANGPQLADSPGDLSTSPPQQTLRVFPRSWPDFLLLVSVLLPSVRIEPVVRKFNLSPFALLNALY